MGIVRGGIFMNNMLKNEMGISRKNKILIVCGLIMFFAVSVFVYHGIYLNTKEVVQEQAVSSITNISQLNKDALFMSINNRRILLQTISERLTSKNIKDVDIILDNLMYYQNAYDFYSMGIIDENYIFHQTSGKNIDVSDNPRNEPLWHGHFHISESFMPADGGKYAVNMFSYPIKYSDGSKYVLVATYKSFNMTKRINFNSLNGKGVNFLINSKGEIAVYPKYIDDENAKNLMAYINDTPSIIPEEDGNSYFKYNNEKYYAHFEKIEFNDWYLMTCMKEADVFSVANIITRSVFLGFTLLWVMVTLAIFVIFLSIFHSKRELKQAVFYDQLLNIGNEKALNVFFSQIPKQDYASMYLIIFDIDRFKEYNFLYGEEAGDELLKYIVRVLTEELPNANVFRYLSDHFIAIDKCDSKQDFEERANKIQRRFDKDIEDGIIQPFDLSVGAKKFQEGESLQVLTSDALIAKGTIKGNLIQRLAFYDEDTKYKRLKYMEMESGFAKALRENEFHVYYQPKYNMATGKIVGAEALVRWVKPDGSIISPGEFIPCFESSRQIILLDIAMLESVCKQMTQMEKDGLSIKKVSVNLSRVHLRQQGILSQIEHIIKDSGVNPANISFEITESALYEDSIPLNYIIEFLHGLGCKVDMDDYGVGVSGPNSLATNDFDVIKLDKSFIDGIGNERMEEVIKSTIQLSKNLGMEILAEGVEEKYQVESLLKWGCTNAQGYFYSRPVKEQEYRELLIADAM